MSANIGFVSTRFAGNDGVSLESAKWAEILWREHCVSYWYAGKLDRDPAASFCVPEAFFHHPESRWINSQVFGRADRTRQATRRMLAMSSYLKSTLYDFITHFDIDLLVLQNVLTIPMHMPLGIAITELLAETQIPAIAHHHDFYWERDRFAVNAVQDYLEMAFPPRLLDIQHVTINQAAQEQLCWRKGLPSILIPNVFDFDNPPPAVDAYAATLREDLGLSRKDLIILQPTRIVPRKGIEHAIELVRMLGDPRCKLVVSHEAGDEGVEYRHLLADIARQAGVDLRFVSSFIGDTRLQTNGRKLYTLWDLYAEADLVTYPSLYEGFGNALLEAIYFRRPVVVNRYSIFGRDIEPKGFRLPIMDGIPTTDLVTHVKRVLDDPIYREEMIAHNYEVAKKFYSYTVLRRKLHAILANLGVNQEAS